MDKFKKKDTAVSKKIIKSNTSKCQSSINKPQSRPPRKEPLKTLYLRIPKSFWKDIKTIANVTGLSMCAPSSSGHKQSSLGN